MSTPLPLTIDIAYHPVELKVTHNHQGMLGTLHIQEKGLSFKGPRMKKDPTIFIPWDKFEGLLKLAETVGLAYSVGGSDEFSN